MLFNSIEFVIFLPIVFILYWLINNKSIRIQNALLLIASYLFYGWWDWRFLSLIAFSSFVDYLVGIGLSKSSEKRKRKALLFVSIFINLGLLGFFKYFNFFAESFSDAFTFFGNPIDATRLNIILPVGISFYTFQSLSYSIDVYKKKLVATRDIIAFFAFVSFFPQLVAGPIERATNLLSQFYKKRVFDYSQAVDGLRQILWGLFKKIVIADNCATFVNDIFANYDQYSGSSLLLGGIFFTIQVYGDFSGYSDIAIGTSRLFGFKLKRNFAYPFFSRDIAEFWRRWHISLSTWFRDYIYIPLGGSKKSKFIKIRNMFIIFVVSGFWHGADWTFVLWGFISALYFLPLLLMNRNRINLDIVAHNRIFPNLRELLQMSFTFLLVAISLVVFRSESVKDAFIYLSILFSKSLFSIPNIGGKQELGFLLAFITFMFVFEWIQRDKNYALEFDNLKIPRVFRWLCYTIILFIMAVFSADQQDFIYFQF